MYAADQAEAWHKGQEWVANYARMTPDQPIYGIDYSVRQSTAPVTEGRKPFRDLKSWTDHAKSQGLKVSEPSNHIDWTHDATDKQGNVRGRFVRTRVPQNSRGFIHQQDVNESREITKLHKLDSVLEKCIEMIRRGHETDPEKYGRVAACLIDNDNNHTYAINMPGPNGTRRHAERVAIAKHLKRHGRIGPNAIMVTTLSPCVNHMDERYGESCTDLLSDYGIEKCYAGWQDPTQQPAEDYPFNLQVTNNADIFNTCRDIAASFLPQTMAEAYTGPPMKFLKPGELSGGYSPQQMQAMGFKQTANGSWYIPMNTWQRLVAGGQIKENFADGRHPEDKGDSKRHHVPTKSSVSNLRRFAKSHSGRAAQLAHWMANMKAGRAKKKKTNEAVDPQTVAAFTARVQDALAKIAQNTDPRYPDQKEFVKLIAANKVKIMNGNPSNPAYSLGHDLNMDADEFHDAPESVLILVIAHEIGHILYGHTFRDPKTPPLTVAQEQQEEYSADEFAVNIMKRLGIQKVPVWTWLRRKKDDLEQFKQDQDAATPGSWPTFNQRSHRARKMGVELTKANTDQIDQALQHMA